MQYFSAILCIDLLMGNVYMRLVSQAVQSPQTTWTTPHPACLPGARVQPAGI